MNNDLWCNACPLTELIAASSTESTHVQTDIVSISITHIIIPQSRGSKPRHLGCLTLFPPYTVYVGVYR